jgi:molecular chaperone GrpE
VSDQENIPEVNTDPNNESADVQDSVGETDIVAQLQAQLEKAQQEAIEAKDNGLRTLAEAQNIRRRAEQEIEKARKFALEKFAGDLLATVDNLERAIEAAQKSGGENVVSLIEGVSLTQKGFLDALAKHGIEVVDPIGHPFNPELHQAMSMIENAETEPNTVIAVMQKGYTLSGRLLRPAMVVVSRPPVGSVDAQA